MELAKSLNFTIKNLTFSPVKGPEGNIEFLGHLSLLEDTDFIPDLQDIVRQAHDALRG